jgi:hypothetical protein
MCVSFSETLEVTVKKVENKFCIAKKKCSVNTLCIMATSQRRVCCHTAKPELNQRV